MFFSSSSFIVLAIISVSCDNIISSKGSAHIREHGHFTTTEADAAKQMEQSDDQAGCKEADSVVYFYLNRCVWK